MIAQNAKPVNPQLVHVVTRAKVAYITTVPAPFGIAIEPVFYSTQFAFRWQLIADPREVAYFRSLADNE